ncbi:hypothetical protein TNCV_1844981 [Trichonephila clavipes]|nr:hypothetical protein TNCV_1844981 [Trichonephila clavipes]
MCVVGEDVLRKQRECFCCIREFLRRENLRRGPMTTKGIPAPAMTNRFKATAKLRVQPSRGCKRVTLVPVHTVRTTLMTHSNRRQTFGGSSAHAVCRQTYRLFLQQYLENIYIILYYVILADIPVLRTGGLKN